MPDAQRYPQLDPGSDWITSVVPGSECHATAGETISGSIGPDGGDGGHGADGRLRRVIA